MAGAADRFAGCRGFAGANQEGREKKLQKLLEKNRNHINPLTEDELAELPRLPEEWRWVKID